MANHRYQACLGFGQTFETHALAAGMSRQWGRTPGRENDNTPLDPLGAGDHRMLA